VKSRTAFALAAAALLGLIVLSAWLAPEPGAPGSALSRASYGWLGARRVLEASGTATEILDVPPRARQGVLVAVFPWQYAGSDDAAASLDAHALTGGTLILGYSGDRISFVEHRVFHALGLDAEDARPDPPLDPRAWRLYSREVWALHTDAEELAGRPAPKVSALRMVPRLPPSGRALFLNDDGRAVVFAYPHGRGRVVVLPAELLANARLGESGNADWLATLAASFPGPWAFDEYHHGLVAHAAAGETEMRTERYMDMYLAQLLLLYVFTALALGRRFGPAWREPAATGGSVAGFLLGLGGMHAEKRHEAEAARVLVARAGELDRRLTIGAPAVAQRAPEFLALAREVGRMQQRRTG
jgi:hypothetical protein